MITISPAVADEVKFLASAPKQVIQGQQFQVVYTLQNAGGDGFTFYTALLLHRVHRFLG